MKKIISLMTCFALLFTCLCFADEYDIPIGYSNPGDTVDIPIGYSNPVQMLGTIEPTIMSITMPSFVPFDITKSTADQNKVLSPRIEVANNSYLPVSIYVEYTNVNLSNLQYTTWSNNGNVGSNQIAIGLSNEVTANTAPKDLYYAKWLVNGYQNLKVMDVEPNGTSAMYVVGTLGTDVPEERTFTVVPTFVVRANN